MMTPAMRKTMLFIQEYMDASGDIPPCYDEICDHLGVANKSAAHRLVTSLIERGYLRRRPYVSRGLEIAQRIDPIYAAYVFDDATKELRRM